MATKDFKIQNQSENPIEISSVTLTPDDVGFSASGLPPLPYSMAPGGELDFVLNATAVSVGTASSTLQIETDTPSSPFTALLSANFVEEDAGGSIEFPFSTASATIPVLPEYTFGDFTFEFWLRAKSSPTPDAFGRIFDNDFVAGFDVNIRPATPVLYFEAPDINSTLANPFNTLNPITFDTFVHYSYVREGNEGRIFINGAADLVRTLNTVPLTPTAGFIYIGAKDPAFASGYISDWRMWNVARTQAEIAATYQTRLNGNEPGLVAYYKFNQPDGVFVDSTGNNVPFTNNGCTYSSVTPPPF